MGAVSTPARHSTVQGQLLQARSRAAPASPEWKKADEEIDKITELQKKRTPEDRHNQRMKALYVEPLEAGWNRPAETSETAARDFLTDAINEYAIQQDAYKNPDLGTVLNFSLLHRCTSSFKNPPANRRAVKTLSNYRPDSLPTKTWHECRSAFLIVDFLDGGFAPRTGSHMVDRRAGVRSKVLIA
jgi:hypothetical protein